MSDGGGSVLPAWTIEQGHDIMVMLDLTTQVCGNHLDVGSSRRASAPKPEAGCFQAGIVAVDAHGLGFALEDFLQRRFFLLEQFDA